jgi:hypothetical protein
MRVVYLCSVRGVQRKPFGPPRLGRERDGRHTPAWEADRGCATRVNVILTTRLTDNGLCSATSSGTMGKSVANPRSGPAGQACPNFFCRKRRCWQMPTTTIQHGRMVRVAQGGWRTGDDDVVRTAQSRSTSHEDHRIRPDRSGSSDRRRRFCQRLRYPELLRAAGSRPPID